MDEIDIERLKWEMRQWTAGWIEGTQFDRNTYQRYSMGEASADLPLVLDWRGKIDPSFINLSVPPILIGKNPPVTMLGDAIFQVYSPLSKLAYGQAYVATIGSYDDPGQLALRFGFHGGPAVTDRATFIDSAEQGIGTRPLSLQPNSGNVGIGTLFPATQLEVAGDAAVIRINRTSLVVGEEPALQFMKGISGTPVAQIRGVNGGGLRFAHGDGTEWARITTDGDVGIGTDLPGYLVHGKRSAAGPVSFQVENPSGGATAQASFIARNNTGAAAVLGMLGSGYGTAGVLSSGDAHLSATLARLVIRTTGANDMIFATNSIEEMRITAAGAVGIGTATPYGMLHVGPGSGPTVGGYPGSVQISPNVGVASLHIKNSLGQEMGMFAHSSGVNYAGSWTNDPFVLRTNNLDRITIAAAGSVAIPYIWNTVLTGTAVHINSNGILTKATSSRRYKRNIQAIGARYGVSFLKGLRPVLYQDRRHFVGTEIVEYGEHEPSPIHVGLIAEEVYEAGGKAFVGLDDEGRPETLHYDRLVTPLLKGWQEHEKRIAKLERKFA